MTYTVPDQHSVDFDLQSYTAPDHLSVDFAFGQSINATVSTVSTSTPGPTLDASGTVTVSADASTVTSSSPAPSVSGTGAVSVSSPVTTVASSTPAPGLGLIIGAAVSSITSTTPSPGVSGSGTVSVDADATIITSSTVAPGVSGTGNVDIASPVTVLTSSVLAPSVDATGNVDITSPVTVLTSSVPAPGVGFENWSIDGTPIANSGLISEIRNWQLLTLKFRSPVTTVQNTIRQLNQNAGDIDIVEDSEGGFTTVDRAGGDNSFTLEAPISRKDVRYITDYRVSQYKEKTIDQNDDRFEITVDLAASSNKTVQDTYPTGLTRSSGEWLFEFDAGEITTTRIHHDINREAPEGVESFDIRTVLEAEETRILEESLRQQAAVNIRTVPDGNSKAEDNSSSSVNTVTITSPSDSSISTGSYIVQEWETEWLNDDFYEVKLSILET